MGATAKITDLASLFGVTERQARNLLAEAGAAPVARGAWPMPGAAQAVFRHLRAARTTSDVSRARAEHLSAQAERTRLATARQARQVIPLEDAQLVADTIAGLCREELQSLPARLGRDRQGRALAEAEVRRAMQAVADRLAIAASALATGDFTGLADHDDDP